MNYSYNPGSLFLIGIRGSGNLSEYPFRRLSPRVEGRKGPPD